MNILLGCDISYELGESEEKGSVRSTGELSLKEEKWKGKNTATLGSFYRKPLLSQLYLFT